MKKFAKYLSYFFLVSAVSSCVYFDDEFIPTTPQDFFRVYSYEYAFLRGYERYDYEDYEEWPSGAMHNYIYSGQTFYVDARTSDGRSTWSNPKFTFKGTSDQDEAWILFLAIFGGGDHKHIYKPTIIMSSPPAHLHLCLDAWNETQTGYGSGKTWKMVSVVDLNGNSLADDPDWTNYTDNLMRFKKTNSFIYVPGAKRSQIELDLFGTQEEHKTLTGTYIVKEDASKKVTLSLSFPDFTQELEVVESNWTSLTLKGTVKGKTGIMHLEPDPSKDNDYSF